MSEYDALLNIGSLMRIGMRGPPPQPGQPESLPDTHERSQILQTAARLQNLIVLAHLRRIL